MSGILIVTEAREGQLRDVSLELAGAGAALAAEAGGPVVAVVVGSNPQALADAIDVAGVDEVVAVTAASAEHFEAHVSDAVVGALIEERAPSVVLVGHTIDGMSLGPALAARLGLGFSSDVTALRWDGELIATRGAYGDKLAAEQRLGADRAALAMLRPGAFPAAEGTGAATRTTAEAPADAVARTRHLGFVQPEGGEVDITKADVLVSIGRGVEDRDELPQYEALADALGATLTASRPLVDAGWLPSSRQVGQSGKTVKPKVYLALGISGAVQHLAGIRDAGTVIAVNIDPDAPIFGVADYGAVARLEDVAEHLPAHFA
jgi:electron transfer flavoprotein alpha subunit